MKVTCFEAGKRNCMNISGETDEENKLLRRLNVGVDQHRSDGGQIRHIRDIEEDRYHNIADLDIPGVPQTYEDFIRRVKLHTDNSRKRLKILDERSKSETMPSEDSDIEPPQSKRFKACSSKVNGF